jgi:hypothetical protein
MGGDSMATEIRLGSNVVANTATIIASSVFNPRHDSVVTLDTGYEEASTARPGTMGLGTSRKRTIKERVSATYKIALTAVIVLTSLSLIIEVCLAGLSRELPTGFQQNLFAAVDFG